MLTKLEITSFIKNLAIELGFDACGIAKAGSLKRDAVRLDTWLIAKYHADMKYMENYFDKRTDPTKLVEGAKSVIVVFQNYFPQKDIFSDKEIKISKYAYGEDYHKVMKDKLFLLFEKIKQEAGELNGRVFVDSAPVLEKAWAREAGLGWIGKNSLLLNKKLGSFFFIGEIIVDLELEYDKPYESFDCANCTRCIDACPTRAIVSNGVIDSEKCLSYNTIENKEEIPSYIKPNMKGWIFGCDICQDVCPWNKKVTPHKVKEFEPNSLLVSLTKEKMLSMTEDEFNESFRNSPLKRAKYKGIRRNILA
jgi:epoxyqueuosine reductase